MIIEFPEKINGNTFYQNVLPAIYQSIKDKDYEIDYDMSNTILANPEGLINTLSAALMIRNKFNYIPNLILPQSPNLLAFFEISGFLDISNIPNCETFVYYKPSQKISNKEKLKGFIPKIYGIFLHSEFNIHFTNVEKIINNIIIQLGDFFTSEKTELESLYNHLQTSINQLIRNTIEHNPSYDNFGILGYYMAQKTPYNTIELVFSDVGQGYRSRIIEMLKENNDNNLEKFKIIKDKLVSNSYLFQKHQNNPNLLAIKNAVDYRSESNIPGLYQIKNFALEKNGYFFIHSGNYSLKYKKINDKEKNEPRFYNTYFSGCHIKLEIPITV